MAESTAVNTISDSVIEQLRCFLCKSYLSCVPIRILQDGNCICGQCSTNHATITRAISLEAVLSNAAFPCSFKQNGCTQRLIFGQTIDHELKCRYRPYMCPSSLTCSWKGSVSQIHDHFIAVHPTLVKQKPDFKIDIDQDSNETFVVVNNNITFIVKYLYDTSKRNLKYEITFCNNSVGNVSYNLQLINDSDAVCFINLKSRDCFVYSDGFYDISDTALDINKFLSNIDNPNCIRVGINFKVRHVNINTENECTTVNYELLNNNLRNRELEFNFRRYDCFLCKDTFRLEAAANHYSEKHQAQQVTKDIFCIKFSFYKRYNKKTIIVLKNNEIFLLEYVVVVEEYYDDNYDVLALDFYSSDLNMNNVTLIFKHDHCKVKSNVFKLEKNERMYIEAGEFPRCFRNDYELTGFIYLNEENIYKKPEKLTTSRLVILEFESNIGN